jgi:hypothetical protein
MGSTNVASKGKELGEACESKAPMRVRRDHEDEDEGLMGHGFCGDGCKVRVAWNFGKMSLPKSGVGQLGSTRKEW